MHKKFYAYLLSIVVIIVLLGNSLLIVGAASIQQTNFDTEPTSEPATLPDENPASELFGEPDNDTPGGISDGTFTFLDPPYLSEDGTTLYNAELARVLILDTNPEMQNLRFPRDPEVEAAIAGTRTARASFSITYILSGTKDVFGYTCSTFPEGAKTAFNAAAAIWASQIQSTVPITINACWTNGLPENVLGASGSRAWHGNFPGAPRPNTWYQAALANSLAGYDLDDTEPDMHITYSSTFDWYYGTDGNTPSTQVDLVSVAAHEIAHGLHFAGTIQYSIEPSGYARYGWETGLPSIYETFMEDVGGTKLTAYPNDSIALGTLVTSNNLWWNGTHANAANADNAFGRVKMYAPGTWAPGSSYSHLDYNTFATTINSLMVYKIGKGSSQHNPGPVTIGMFKDMGWKIGNPPPVPTDVFASAGTFTDKVRVTWGASNTFDYKTFLPLILSGGGGSVPIPEAPYFQVYRNTSNDSSGAGLPIVSGLTSSPYDDTTADPGTTYFYWVKACNSAGCSGFSAASNAGYRAGEITIPAAPTGVAASDGTSTEKVEVSWTASAGATSYDVYRHTSDDSLGAGSIESSHPASHYDDMTAEAGVTYYYWVKACNSAGCSGFSASDQGYRAGEITIPSAPTGVAASSTYTDKVVVSWTASAGATSYDVYRHTSDDSSGAGTPIVSGHTSSPYDDMTAVTGTPYYYWVKACNSAGCSGFSASAQGSRLTSTIVNGDFEAGPDVGWTQYSFKGWPLIYQDTSGFPYSGEWFAWLGGDHDETSQIYQDVTISASQHYLHFWYWVDSAEDYCGYDFVHVKVNGEIFDSLDLCNANNTYDWVNAVFNLSAYNGQTVTLMFEVTTDSTVISDFFLDTVSLSSSSGAATIEFNPREVPVNEKLEKQQAGE